MYSFVRKILCIIIIIELYNNIYRLGLRNLFLKLHAKINNRKNKCFKPDIYIFISFKLDILYYIGYTGILYVFISKKKKYLIDLSIIIINVFS